MNRRDFIALSAAASQYLPRPALAQRSASKVPLVVLMTIASVDDRMPLFAERLAKRGLMVGKNIQLQLVHAGGRSQKFPGLTETVVRARPDVIIVFGSAQIRVVQNATSSIPIVAVGELLSERLITSLAAPGGNTTGINLLTRDLDLKKLEIVRELQPKLDRVGVLHFNAPRDPDKFQFLARRLRFELVHAIVHGPNEYASSFQKFHDQGVSFVVVANTSLFSNTKDQIIALAHKHRIAAICEWPHMTKSGCLASYGYAASDYLDGTADYVTKILAGSRPSDLPASEPTRFALAVNLKTAKALGITIPPSILLRADEVIE